MNKNILLSIGKLGDKKLLLPYIKTLSTYKNFVLFATEKTNKFLKKYKVQSQLVYKISEIGNVPNIAVLINNKEFDLIINIPTSDASVLPGNEFTDGKLIRKGAIRLGIQLITDSEVAISVIDSLIRSIKK